jgi:integrase/recombinase XerD
MVDTGARAKEVQTLKRGSIDWDSLLVTLKGKGGKERRVPISLECRKVLFRWLQTHQFDYVFATRTGAQLRYDNMRRDFLWLLNKAGVQKNEGSFHAFRRFFGKSYLRKGGNLIYLQKLFGHASLQMTQRYVEADEEDLQRAHRALSPLEGLKKR